MTTQRCFHCGVYADECECPLPETLYERAERLSAAPSLTKAERKQLQQDLMTIAALDLDKPVP